MKQEDKELLLRYLSMSLPYEDSDVLNKKLLSQLKQIINNYVHSNR